MALQEVRVKDVRFSSIVIVVDFCCLYVYAQFYRTICKFSINVSCIARSSLEKH